jgi:hypothetical protein
MAKAASVHPWTSQVALLNAAPFRSLTLLREIGSLSTYISLSQFSFSTGFYASMEVKNIFDIC